MCDDLERDPHVASLGKSSTICNLSVIFVLIVKPSEIVYVRQFSKKKNFLHTISRRFCHLSRVAPRPFFSKLPRRRNSEPSRAIKAAQHQQLCLLFQWLRREKISSINIPSTFFVECSCLILVILTIEFLSVDTEHLSTGISLRF